MQGDSWGKAKIIRVAVIDMIFAGVLLCVHAVRLVVRDGREDEFPASLLAPDQLWAVSILIWISIFAVNILQLIVSFNLFSALKEDVPEPLVFISVSKMWSRFSLFIVLLLGIKIIIFGSQGGVYYVRLTLAVLEMVFKIVALVVVHLFVRGLLTACFVPSAPTSPLEEFDKDPMASYSP